VLSLSYESAEKYCTKARQTERERQENDAWDLWLDCVPQTEIAKRIGIPVNTIGGWVTKRESGSDVVTPPGEISKKTPHGNIQHFDLSSLRTCASRIIASAASAAVSISTWPEPVS